MEKSIKILFVEDNPIDVDLAVNELRRRVLKFEYLRVDAQKPFIKALQEFSPDVVISDYAMPSYDGMKALSDTKGFDPLLPFILFTGATNEMTAVECMKAGAEDYIIKEHIARLPFAVMEVLEKRRIQTEKKRADLLLKENEEKLQCIFRAAPVGIGLVKNRIILEINEHVCLMTGYTRDQLIGNDSRIFYPSREEYDFVGSEKYRQMNNTGRGVVETRWINKDGTIINILLSSTWLQNNDHDKGAIFTALDITTRKKSEENLKQSQSLLQNALKLARMGSWEYDVETDLFRFNDLFYSVYRTSAEKVGSYMMSSADYAKSFVHPEDLQMVAEEIRKALKSDDPSYSRQIEHRIIYADGEHGFINVRFFTIKDENGKTIKTFGVNQDVTEQKKTELELIKAKEKAEESDRLKTAFLHNISHEIRTPMNAIVGFSSLLSEPDIDNTSRESYIEMILKSSDHLLKIISDIIDVASIEANTVKINKVTVSLMEVFNSLYEQYLPFSRNKGLMLRTEYDVLDTEMEIVTDKTKLIQILTNLLNNAVKYTSKGEIVFGYKYKPEEDMVEFFVSDTGIGIPPEHQVKIFDRFYQVEGPESKLYEGTGLGLSISKAFTELLGGKISVESKPSEGARFSFTLPCQQKSLAETHTSIRKKEPEMAFQGKKKILVAEDVESNFKLINYILSSANFEVIRARNGQEAVDAAMSDSNIDLILMDIKMPVMDGYSSTRLLRDNGLRIPIIAQTAYYDDKIEALEAGCSEIITKPFNKRELLQVLQKFL